MKRMNKKPQTPDIPSKNGRRPLNISIFGVKLGTETDSDKNSMFFILAVFAFVIVILIACKPDLWHLVAIKGFDLLQGAFTKVIKLIKPDSS